MPNTKGANKKVVKTSGQDVDSELLAVVYSRPWMARFLAEFALGCNIKDAAKVARVGRTTVHYAREQDAVFSAAFEAMREEAADRIRAEVSRRAIDGWEEPVFGRVGKDQDGIVGYVRKFDSALLARLAVAHCPEFRTKEQAAQTVNINITITPEKLRELQERTRLKFSGQLNGDNLG